MAMTLLLKKTTTVISKCQGFMFAFVVVGSGGGGCGGTVVVMLAYEDVIIAIMNCQLQTKVELVAGFNVQETKRMGAHSDG